MISAGNIVHPFPGLLITTLMIKRKPGKLSRQCMSIAAPKGRAVKSSYFTANVPAFLPSGFLILTLHDFVSQSSSQGPFFNSSRVQRGR